MSLKDKADAIDFSRPPEAQQAPRSAERAAAARPKTAPGEMLSHVVVQKSELVREVEELRARVGTLSEVEGHARALKAELMTWEGAKAARYLDPKRVTWSEWANRDEANFTGKDFEDLKEEIASAGGNVQPIKVRALKPGAEKDFEIIFGHRRHRACLELGLAVLALVDNIGEVELFSQMDRENRGRKNLSAFEQGRMYAKALERGLFPSSRQLAEKVGADLGNVGKALALARLPAEVVEAFASPLDLQFRWAKPLTDAVNADAEGCIARSVRAKALGSDRSPAEVLAAILGGGAQAAEQIMFIERAGKEAGKIELDAKGRAKISLGPQVLKADQLGALKELIESFLSKQPKQRR